jgi:hypothetical protein
MGIISGMVGKWDMVAARTFPATMITFWVSMLLRPVMVTAMVEEVVAALPIVKIA